MSGAPSAPAPRGRGGALTVASLNLYHWAEPGIGWYEPEAGHSAASWSAKQAWLAAMLSEMDADVIGFQEVVSIEALRASCAAAGYPHLALVAEPVIRPAPPGAANAAFYRRPVNAVAARHPIEARAAAIDPALPRSLGLAADRGFRRPVVRAAVEAPGFGPAVVYCAHLKSPGVNEYDAPLLGAETPPDAAEALARWRLEGLSRATAYAMIQRVFEAAALYAAATADLAEDPERVVIAVGDMNDTPESAALSALTPFGAFERDGGALGQEREDEEREDEERENERSEDEDCENEDREDQGGASARFRLVDAARLAPRSLRQDGRAPTHRMGAEGTAIDHILVSAGAGGGVDVSAYTVHDRHFRGGDPAASSDHAGVSARLSRS